MLQGIQCTLSAFYLFRMSDIPLHHDLQEGKENGLPIDAVKGKMRINLPAYGFKVLQCD